MNNITFGDKTLTPSKIICIGRNYAEHAAELGNERPDEPVIFIKPNSAIGDCLYSNVKEPVHYEGEICLLIEGGQYSGVGFGLDLTKRELQTKLKGKGLPWERAKAFDRSAVFSGFVPLDGELDKLRLELWINDQKIQQGGYDAMMFKPEEVLTSLLEDFTFEDGDILMTGTPKGVGEVKGGDQFTGRIYLDSSLLVEKIWEAR